MGSSVDNEVDGCDVSGNGDIVVMVMLTVKVIELATFVLTTAIYSTF